jgi:outer membrane protein insertion porin family
MSCAAIKKPPHNVPFVYDNKINLKAPKLGGEEKSLLVEKLYTYLDDSMQVPQRSILGFTQRLKPALFDSGNVTRSISFMNGYLNSLGYYAASFDTFTVKMDTIPDKNQIRVTTTFNVNIGKNLTVDTLIYALDTPNVQPLLKYLADSAIKNAVLKRNSPYSKDAVAAELERLATLFRNNGFFRMSRNALIIEADTTDPSLISFDNDPIEQLLQAQRRREDPRIILKVLQRPGVDSNTFRQYYIDSVYIYPETKITEEPELLINDTTLNTLYGKQRPIVIKERQSLFRPRLIRRNNYLIPTRLYNDVSYFRTINNFWRMGPWQQVDVKTFLHYDSIAKVNFHVFLYPAKKQNFQIDLEGSQNNNISVSNVLSGRFFAISVNATHRGRNLFRSGVQSTTSARVGFELNYLNKDAPFFQALLLSGTQSFSIPKLIWPFTFLDRRKLDATRSQLSFSALYTDRFDFYKQVAFTAGLQWEVRKGKNSYTWSVPNFESVSINETDSLRKEIDENPSLQYAFTPGNILSTKMSWEHKMSFKKNPRRAGFFRFAGELSPFDFEIFNKESFQFVRIEGQIVHSVQHAKSSMNYRAYAGVGWNFDKDASGKIASLPYYRQYIAGGSNSMRAWGLRQLGIGRSIVSDTTDGFTDRFGDIQFEMNAELRFKLFRLFGFNIGGTVYTDIGNIWNHTNNIDGEGKFLFKNLYYDLAMDIGTGIRWDVSYLVIRLDAAYKVKDPVREGAGWMKTIEWKTENRLGTEAKNNIGFQFGIGYPF